MLLSADREPFKGLAPHAIEDGASLGDVTFLNETIRESQAQIAAGRGFAPTENYFEAKREVLRAAMTDAAMIDAEGDQVQPLLVQWGREWAELIRGAAQDGSACASYDAEIIGQAIVGALHQTGREAHRSGRCRDALVANLTRFLTRALKPD